MRVVVAMSGGIDSSVCAYLLKKSGYDVIGVFLQNGIKAVKQNLRSCCSIYDAYDARRTAEFLGIPFYAINFKPEFERLIQYFVDEYNRGRTPNPCVLCNRDIKFGKLFEFANAIGADYIATGHYARIEDNLIKKAKDPLKEQSYMLALVKKEVLGRIILPLANMLKSQVRQIAREAGIIISQKPDSQEICFVPGNDYTKLLYERTPEMIKDGNIVDTSGRVVGKHKGYQLFTIGQRRGLGLTLAKPVYVLRIDPTTNTIVVGTDEELFHDRMVVQDMNWFIAPKDHFRCTVKIRYRSKEVLADVKVIDKTTVEVKFRKPSRAITPGQIAVFFKGDTVIAGGTIAKVI